ncbi:MAG TPA: hypothetical protein VEP50_17820 [bacterium]|nr:hypothetical protein [bacterium]
MRALGRASGEVERYAFLLFLHSDREPQRVVTVEIARVEVVFKDVGSVGYLADPRTHTAFGVVQQVFHCRGERLDAVAGKEVLHAADPQPVGGELSPKVPDPFVRELAVEQNELHNVLAPNVSLDDPNRRDAQSLLPNMPSLASVKEIGMVTEVGHKADEMAFVKDKSRHHDVGQMSASRGIRIVADEHVAVTHFVHRVMAQDRFDDSQERPQVDGNVRRLRQRPASGIEDRGGRIPALFDVVGVCGPNDSFAQFFGDRQQSSSIR